VCAPSRDTACANAGKNAPSIDREAAATAAAQLATDRAHKLVDLEKLIDASEVTYAQNLRRGDVRISPADLPRLHKLRKDIWHELEAQPVEPPAPPADEDADPAERKLQVLRALHDAGALQQLRDLVDEPPQPSLGHSRPDDTAVNRSARCDETEPTGTDE
jgi:hypothetical protein